MFGISCLPFVVIRSNYNILCNYSTEVGSMVFKLNLIWNIPKTFPCPRFVFVHVKASTFIYIGNI